MKRKLLLLILNIVFVCFVNLNLKAQCSNFDAQWPLATQTTTSSTLVNIESCLFGGEYAVCDVVIGATYRWTTCSAFQTKKYWRKRGMRITEYNTLWGRAIGEVREVEVGLVGQNPGVAGFSIYSWQT